MDNDSAAALAELSQAIAGEILTMPELSDPEWDTYRVARRGLGLLGQDRRRIGTPSPDRRCRPRRRRTRRVRASCAIGPAAPTAQAWDVVDRQDPSRHGATW